MSLVRKFCNVKSGVDVYETDSPSLFQSQFSFHKILLLPHVKVTNFKLLPFPASQKSYAYEFASTSFIKALPLLQNLPVTA